MFFKIAFRNLFKRKIFALINIFGLSVGLAACTIIYLHIHNERSYDESFQNNIYRLAREHSSGGHKSASACVNYKIGELIREKLSGLVALTQFSKAGEIEVQIDGNNYIEKNALFADQQFINVFDLKFVSGNSANALHKPYNIVITQKTANRLFSNSNPINHTIDINGQSYVVTGVVESFPQQSHFNFDFLISLESTRNIYSKSKFEHWGNIWTYTYFIPARESSISDVEHNINQIALTYGPRESLENFNTRFYTQKLSDIHLRSNLSLELSQNGDIQFLYILGAVALLILFIACFNFINLTTARSIWRAKEVGVKKVLGINRKDLILQFTGEALLTTSIAFILCLIWVQITLPIFSDFLNTTITQTELLIATPFLIIIVLFVGVVSGSIPAFLISSFEPIKVLKGISSQGDKNTAKRFREILIFTQFTIAITLIIGGIVIYQQLMYIKTKDLGINVNNIVVIDLNNKRTRNSASLLVNKLNALPQVASTAMSSDAPFNKLNSWRIRLDDYENSNMLINVMSIDEHSFNSFELTLVEGNPQNLVELDKNKIMVNQAFIKHLMITDPIGSSLDIQTLGRSVKIVGVVKDFHFESLHQQIKPLILFNNSDWVSKILIKTQPQDLAGSLKAINDTWKEINPEDAFDYSFISDSFKKLYVSEERTGTMVTFFSFLSILIACLGLYGLAAYVAETKIKEISIRKVLGANLKNLIGLQFGIFLRLILLAGIVAVPLSIWIMTQWLDNFAYRVSIEWWVIIAALITVLLFTILSVGYRSYSAAKSNPTNNLRME